ncbi:DUF5324 family protein [Streptomyces sodiiphilus]|uniref:DUF5324 family protein n=1 Tax=Streptomyces sodiiphilus TaxID=226217 RepID=A0ABP5AT88_9ACTN
MTRNNSVRAASDNAKDSVRHAAEVVAPYAVSARDSAVHYAHEAGSYLRPHADRAAKQARKHYTSQLAPRLQQARGALPDGFDGAAERTREAARKARAAAGPRVEEAVVHAREAAGPVREAAMARSAATMAALRGELTAKDVRKVAARRRRRGRTVRALKRLGVIGAVLGAGLAVWKWWDRQNHPDWLMGPTAATEVGEFTPGAEQELLDPDTEARQAEAEIDAGIEADAPERQEGRKS